MEPTRPNDELARIVEQGIRHPSGRFAGARFMLDRGVRFSVIVRVLAPGERVRTAAGAESPLVRPVEVP